MLSFNDNITMVSRNFTQRNQLLIFDGKTTWDIIKLLSLPLMLTCRFILVWVLTDGVFCVFNALSGGEECRLWRALPQYEARPAGNEGARRVHPREVKFAGICVGGGARDGPRNPTFCFWKEWWRNCIKDVLTSVWKRCRDSCAKLW